MAADAPPAADDDWLLKSHPVGRSSNDPDRSGKLGGLFMAPSCDADLLDDDEEEEEFCDEAACWLPLLLLLLGKLRCCC